MTQMEMMHLVPQKLKQIETEYGIHILYAAESGSRAWGLASEQSDFDIRFIYIRSREDYLRLDPCRDVLEFPIGEGWDMAGWDIAKMLRLLRNSNSQIFEWFSSPIVYLDDGFSERFRPVLEAYFSRKTMVYHYLHQAALKRKQMPKEGQVKVKHYLYILQHLASTEWVLRFGKQIPVSFRELAELLPEEIRPETEALLLQKTCHYDTPFVSRSPKLDAWIEMEFRRIREALEGLPAEGEKPWQMLNDFFLTELELR